MAVVASKAMRDAQTEALIEAAKDDMPNYARKFDLIAEARKIQFDAFKRKGFTSDEALYLTANTEIG